MKKLKGKNAVVTGAGSGIGSATAIEMAREGMNVVIADIDGAAMEQTAVQIRSFGVKAAVKKTDVSQKEQVKALVDFAVEEFGGIDLMMNNAGVGMAIEMQDMSLEEDMEWIVGINLWGPIYGCYYVLPHMLKRGSGHIVNISSFGVFFPTAGDAGYSLTKAAIYRMTEVLRVEVARHGIGVTCVCPGFTKTPIFGKTKTRGTDIDTGGIKFGARPEKTAIKILKGVKKNKGLVLPAIDAKIAYYCRRFFPILIRGYGVLSAKYYEKHRIES